MRRFLLGLFSMIATYAFANDVVFSLDVPRHPSISPAEFTKHIDTGIAILKRSQPLSVDDGILLVRVANTIRILDGAGQKREKEFLELFGVAEENRLTQALGEWIPNRGLGMYFTKYDLHFGGARGNIRARDRFYVADGDKNEKPNSPEPAPSAIH